MNACFSSFFRIHFNKLGDYQQKQAERKETSFEWTETTLSLQCESRICLLEAFLSLNMYHDTIRVIPQISDIRFCAFVFIFCKLFLHNFFSSVDNCPMECIQIRSNF